MKVEISAALIFGAVVFVEVLVRTKLVALTRSLGSSFNESLAIMKEKGISDELKQKKILGQSKRTMIQSMKILFSLAFSTAVFLLVYLSICFSAGTGPRESIQFLLLPVSQIAMVILAIGYIYLRKYLSKNLKQKN